MKSKANEVLAKYKEFLIQFHTEETVKSYIHRAKNYLSSNPNAMGYTYNEIVMHLADFKRQYTSELTQISHLIGIKRFYDFLVYTNVIENHPCKNLFIRTHRRPIQTDSLFTPEELEMLFNREGRYKNINMRNKVLIGFMIYQGLRSEELTRLKLDDCNLDEGTLFIRKSNVSNKRVLELKSRQIIHLINYLERARPNLLKVKTDNLLVTYHGGSIGVDSISKIFKSLKSLFPEKKLNPITIRQSVIYNWLNLKNYPLSDVQIMAGHKYPSSTEKYLSKDMESRRRLINKYYPLY